MLNSKQFFCTTKWFCFENSDFEHSVLFRISDLVLRISRKDSIFFAIKWRCSIKQPALSQK